MMNTACVFTEELTCHNTNFYGHADSYFSTNYHVFHLFSHRTRAMFIYRISNGIEHTHTRHRTISVSLHRNSILRTTARSALRSPISSYCWQALQPPTLAASAYDAYDVRLRISSLCLRPLALRPKTPRAHRARALSAPPFLFLASIIPPPKIPTGLNNNPRKK